MIVNLFSFVSLRPLLSYCLPILTIVFMVLVDVVVVDVWFCDLNPTHAFCFGLQVSLDSRVREVINRNMVEPTPHTFDEAQLQIFTLMHRDSYPRFLNSQLYKRLLQQYSSTWTARCTFVLSSSPQTHVREGPGDAANLVLVFGKGKREGGGRPPFFLPVVHPPPRIRERWASAADWLLCCLGGSDEDTTRDGMWWGPHKTSWSNCGVLCSCVC